jgi:hypothetical protein
MSKFKSFASQGSFRDYLLQAPDTTAKEQREISRVVGQKKENLAWRNEQENLYLQSQKIGYDLEKQSRDLNFKLETEARQARRDQLNQDYELQVQADQQRLAAQQQDLKNISQFSKTAFELGTQINNQITENQTKANATRAYAAGADFKTVAAIQSLTNNLTKAEFAQQDFIRDKLEKSGGNLDAYWALYQNRNTRGFINNIAVAQNTAYAFDDAARIHIEKFKNANPSATVDEQLVAFKTFRDETVASFTDANGRALNPELLNSTVYPIIRNIETRILGEFNREKTVEQEGVRFTDVVRGLNVEFANKGAAGIAEWFRTDNSPQKRKDLIRWLNNNAAVFGPGGMTSDQIKSIMDYAYEGPNLDKDGQPKRVSMMEQFKGTDFAGQLAEVYKVRRKAEINQHNITEQEGRIALDNRLTELYNKYAEDGSLTKDEYARLEAEADNFGIPGYESPILKEAYLQQDSVRTSEALSNILTAEYNAGTLTVERVNSIKGLTGQAKQNFLNLAAQQQKQRESPAYKTDVAAIKAAVSQDPRVKAAPVTGKENYSVLLMQDRFVRQYKETLQRTGSNDEARAVTLAAIQTLLTNPKSITKEGLYADVVQQEAQFATKGKGTLENYKEFVNVLSDPDVRNNPTKLANTLGAATVYSAYDDMQAGKPTSAIIKNGAALMGMAPIDFVNYLASGANDPNMKPITFDTQVEEIRKNMKPITRRLYNVNRTNERVERANHINNGTVSSASTRGAFNVVQYVANDPRFKDRTFGPIVYDEHGHGGANMHVHYEFATKEEALAAKALYESKGFRISSFMRPQDTGSAHSKGFAIDVAPPTTLPYNEQAELEWIRSANAVIGYDPTQVN